MELLYNANQRVVMGSDLRDREHGLHRAICGIIPGMSPTLHVPTAPMLEIVEKVRERLIGEEGPWDIFVDGSHIKTGGPLSSTLFPEDSTVSASASVVMMTRADNW